MQNAVGCPVSFLTPTSRVIKDSFGLEIRLLLVLQCCHDCRRRKAAGDQAGNSPWGSKSMMDTQIPPSVPHSVHCIRHYQPWKQLGKKCKGAGMIQAAPKLTRSYSQNRCNREGTTTTLRSVLDISESEISYNCYRLPFIVNGSSTKLFKT